MTPPAKTFILTDVKQPGVNVEEKIERVVGRRTRMTANLEAGMKFQDTALALHKAFGHRWPAHGVYRFKTHEEADEWMMKLLARSGAAKS